MNNLLFDIINYINGFLQHIDQIAWKLSSKYYLKKLIYNKMNLNNDLNLYVKTIDDFEYSFKDDYRYIQIENLSNNYYNKFDILDKYIVLSDLLYFDFNTEFDIFYGNYIIMFLTSVTEYIINIQHIDSITGIITYSTFEQKSSSKQNLIKIKFETKGKIKVNCREFKKLNYHNTIQYIMCIPEYYWNKIYNYNNKNKLFDWKKQIVLTHNKTKLIRNIIF
jgi:hypothetical protein